MGMRIMLHPPQEACPRRIADALGQMAVLDQIADLQVFVGNPVARRDERACQLPGMVLTLPIDMQLRSG
jgi:hypothetical protein